LEPIPGAFEIAGSIGGDGARVRADIPISSAPPAFQVRSPETEDETPTGGVLSFVRTGCIGSIATLGMEVVSGVLGIAKTICGG
jgi:hypothetical protein